MKKYFLTLTLLCLTVPAFAQEIEIYLECQKSVRPKMCKEFFESPGDEHSANPQSKLSFEMQRSMAFNSFNVVDAAIINSDPAHFMLQNEVSIRLSDRAAKRFAELTQHNIGKRIGLVCNNKLLMAPVIESAIEDGNINLTPGVGSYDPLIAVPWLKEKIDDVQTSKTRKRNVEFFLYVLIAAVTFGATMKYAFSKNKIKSDEEETA